MPRKKKQKKLKAAKEARRVARDRLGPPPAERVIQDKRSKPPKHKPTIGQLQSE
jgi:hypothetical protein